MLVNNTPVEQHQQGALRILVKREDLCCPLPGPSFSKMRGVVAHIQNRPEPVIGVLDTFHSKAGWAVSWACHELGKAAVNFWPRYKADGDVYLPREQQQRAEALGASMFALPAGRSAVLYHGAKKRLAAAFPDRSYMMPNALKLPESVTENAAEARRTCEAGEVPASGVLVLSVSSGTVAAGVIRGFAEAGLLDRYRVLLHMGYSRSVPTMRQYMSAVSGLNLDSPRFEFVDEGYGYADAARGDPAPFPCNPYYDRKAWRWLGKPEQQERLRGVPIVFWNIGE
ncbi:threonine dehydratase [Stenotrophomonas phage vB_SmaS_Bhz59]